MELRELVQALPQSAARLSSLLEAPHSGMSPSLLKSLCLMLLERLEQAEDTSAAARRAAGTLLIDVVRCSPDEALTFVARIVRLAARTFGENVGAVSESIARVFADVCRHSAATLQTADINTLIVAPLLHALQQPDKSQQSGSADALRQSMSVFTPSQQSEFAPALCAAVRKHLGNPHAAGKAFLLDCWSILLRNKGVSAGDDDLRIKSISPLVLQCSRSADWRVRLAAVSAMHAIMEHPVPAGIRCQLEAALGVARFDKVSTVRQAVTAGPTYAQRMSKQPKQHGTASAPVRTSSAALRRPASLRGNGEQDEARGGHRGDEKRNPSQADSDIPDEARARDHGACREVISSQIPMETPLRAAVKHTNAECETLLYGTDTPSSICEQRSSHFHRTTKSRGAMTSRSTSALVPPVEQQTCGHRQDSNSTPCVADARMQLRAALEAYEAGVLSALVDTRGAVQRAERRVDALGEAMQRLQLHVVRLSSDARRRGARGGGGGDSSLRGAADASGEGGRQSTEDKRAAHEDGTRYAADGWHHSREHEFEGSGRGRGDAYAQDAGERAYARQGHEPIDARQADGSKPRSQSGVAWEIACSTSAQPSQTQQHTSSGALGCNSARRGALSHSPRSLAPSKDVATEAAPSATQAVVGGPSSRIQAPKPRSAVTADKSELAAKRPDHSSGAVRCKDGTLYRQNGRAPHYAMQSAKPSAAALEAPFQKTPDESSAICSPSLADSSWPYYEGWDAPDAVQPHIQPPPPAATSLDALDMRAQPGTAHACRLRSGDADDAFTYRLRDPFSPVRTDPPPSRQARATTVSQQDASTDPALALASDGRLADAFTLALRQAGQAGGHNDDRTLLHLFSTHSATSFAQLPTPLRAALCVFVESQLRAERHAQVLLPWLEQALLMSREGESELLDGHAWQQVKRTLRGLSASADSSGIRAAKLFALVNESSVRPMGKRDQWSSC